MRKFVAYLLSCVFVSSVVMAQCTAQMTKKETKPTVKQEQPMKTHKTTKTTHKKMKKEATKTGGAAKVRGHKRTY